MNKIKEDLKKLDSTIEQAKTTIAESEGSIKTLLTRLKEEEKLATESAASKELEKLSKRIARSDKNIRSEYEELRENYSW